MGMTTEALDVVIDATSEQRVINNVARHEYRVLSEAEKADMKEIKDLGAALIAKIEEVKARTPSSGIYKEFEVSVTRAQEAVMWAVKGLTA